MEKGFYHPERGYWQTVGNPPQNILDGYPEGTVEVPLKPGANYHWVDGAWFYRAPTYAPSKLSPAQFEFLLAYTGFGDVWDQLAANAKAVGDMTTYAGLAAERKRSEFRIEVVLNVVAQFAPQIPEGVDLSEATIRQAWKAAEQYRGLG